MVGAVAADLRPASAGVQRRLLLSYCSHLHAHAVSDVGQENW